jgi:regulator of RNase E activity RraA
MREDLSRTEILSDPEYPPRKAIEDIPPGQVLVADCRGDLRAGVLGDILALRLQVRGVAGIVSDGPMRDIGQLAEMDWPIFCQGGAAPATLSVHLGADLQCPIACGGVAVLPGDIMVGDEDGVLVVPRSMAAEVARDGAEQEGLEVFLKQQIADGRATPGVYPANAATLAAYNEWRSKN